MRKAFGDPGKMSRKGLISFVCRPSGIGGLLKRTTHAQSTARGKTGRGQRRSLLPLTHLAHTHSQYRTVRGPIAFFFVSTGCTHGCLEHTRSSDMTPPCNPSFIPAQRVGLDDDLGYCNLSLLHLRGPPPVHAAFRSLRI